MCVLAPLCTKVGQTSFTQGRGDSSDLEHIYKQLPVGATQRQNIHCFLLLYCFNLFGIALLKLWASHQEEIRSTNTASPETTSQQTVHFLHSFTGTITLSIPLQSYFLREIVSHSHTFIVSHYLFFCSTFLHFFLLIICVISQVKLRLTH